MPVLILSPRYSYDSQALRDAARSEGWSIQRLGDYVAPPEFKMYDVAIYGEAIFARLVAKSLDMVLIQPSLRWLATLPHQYQQRDVVYTTLGEARQLSKPRFIKPAGEKSFAAQVYSSGELLPAPNLVADTTPVLIIEPVEWELEFRSFVLDGQVQTISIYKREGVLARNENGEWNVSPSEMETALDYCQSVLDDPLVAVPPALVLDVGLIKGTGWAVIEANPASASGIYGCDPVRILPIIKRASVKKISLSEADTAWI